MMWFYLVLLSVLGTAIANIFRRVAMKHDKSDVIAYTIIFQWIGAIIVGIFAVWHGFVLPPIAKYPVNIIIQAIFWGSATLLLFKASQYLEASETAIIGAGNSLVTIIAVLIFLHEKFSPVYILGTALIMIAIFFISHHGKKMNLNKGTMYALGYCFMSGLGNTNDAFMVKFSHSDPLSLLTLGFFMPGVFLLLVRPTAIKHMPALFRPAHFTKMFLLTFFFALAAIAFFFALFVGGQASQISPINQASIIVTVLIAAVFLRERDHLWKKVICTILVTLGVLLLR